MQNKHKVIIIVILAVIIIFTVLTNLSDREEEERNLNETPIENDEYPAAVQTWLENMRPYFAAGVVDLEAARYLIVNWGRKNTGGFQVEITEVNEENDQITTNVFFREPEGIVTQVITYPSVVKRIEANQEKEVVFRPEGAEEYIPRVIGPQPITPFIAESINIKIMEKELKDDRIIVKGLARVFEANVNYEFIDYQENIIEEGFTTAASAGPDWGGFTIEIEEITADYLNVFSISMKDGSRENEVQITLN